MRLPGVKTARLAAQWLRSRLRRGALILSYHHIGTPDVDPYQTYVSANHLAEQLEVVGRHARPMPLLEMLDCLRRDRLPARAVAITFDDGYADTLYAAKPCLDAFSVPATVFITTGSWGREYWWDELVHLWGRTGPTGPGTRAMASEAEFIRPPGKRDADAAHQAAQRPSGAQPLMAFYRHLLHLSLEHRQSALEGLRQQVGVSLDWKSPWRALTQLEAIQLGESDLIEIGAHSVTHPLLPEQASSEQFWEIEQSKLQLENLLRRSVAGFAYPNGAFAATTRRMLEQIGYVYACASQPGVVAAHSDAFALPRFWIPNWDGGTFRRWLNLWLVP